MLNIGKIIGKFVKNSSQRELDRLKSIVEQINVWETKIKELPDESFPPLSIFNVLLKLISLELLMRDSPFAISNAF